MQHDYWKEIMVVIHRQSLDNSQDVHKCRLCIHAVYRLYIIARELCLLNWLLQHCFHLACPERCIGKTSALIAVADISRFNDLCILSLPFIDISKKKKNGILKIRTTMCFIFYLCCILCEYCTCIFNHNELYL